MIIIAVLLIGYSLLRYYHLWKRFRIPNVFYFVFQALLLGTLFIWQYVPRWMNQHEVIFYIVQIVMTLYAAVMLFTPILCFFRGAIRITGKIVKAKGRVYHYFNHPAKSIYAIFVITIVLGAFSFVGSQFIVNREYLVGTPEGKNEIKIVWLSDIHLGTSVTRFELDSIIEKVNTQKADMIFLGGDMIDENTSPELMQYAGKKWQTLQAKYGVFFVEGAYESSQETKMKLFYQKIGINGIYDQQLTLGNGIQLLGCRNLTNPKKKEMEFYQSMFFNREQPIFVFAHEEKDFEKWEEFGVDLFLSAEKKGTCKKIGNMNAITSQGIGDYGIIGNFIPWKSREIVTVTYRW